MTNQRQQDNTNSKTEIEQKQKSNQSQRETNDNSKTATASSPSSKQQQHFNISTSKLNPNSRTGSSCDVAAIQQHLAVSQQLAAASPMRQSRPLRPNLRRQLMVQASDGSGLQQISVIVPPQRPAHLPARYDHTQQFVRHPNQQQLQPVQGQTTGEAAAAAANSGSASASGSGTKPNRYSWAQMQQWQANQAQAAAAAALSSNPHAQQLHNHHHHGFHHHFSSPFSSAASRVLVVNPMQIVNLSEHTKSSLIKFIEAIKRFSEQWFSHVLLLMFLAVYACFGAYIFISFEAPSEQWEKQLIIDTRFKIVNESYDVAKEKDRDDFVDLFRNKFEDYERLLNRACQSGMTSSSLDNQWTFWGALFYSMTVFTTIGYGHLTPITFAGRVATMIYAIFGIPILLMVLADLGKLLTRIIKYAFKKFRYLYNKLLKRKTSVKTRKLISENTNQYIGVARNAFERGFSNYIQPQYNKIPQAFRSSLPKHQQQQHNNKAVKCKSDTQIIDQQPIGELTLGMAGNEENSQTIDDLKRKKSDSNQNQTTDVILTPIKQSKPVSPQPSDSKKSPFENYHHNNNNSRNQSSGVQSKRKISSSNPTPFGSGKKNCSSSQANKSSISRSSSSSGLTQNNHNQSGLTKSAKPISERKSSQEKQQDGDKTLQQHDLPAQEKAGSKNDELQSGEKAKPELILEVNHSELDINRARPLEKALIEQQEVRGGDEEVEEEYEEEEEDFDIPVSFALFLLVTYMMFGAVVFSIWEGWNFFDSLYFVFISMSTIGFGDLVPQHPKRMIGTFIYLLFGLALTSMCINVVQEKIHATFLRAKMQIGEKMGLDLDQIMADDYYDGSLGMDGYEEEEEEQDEEEDVQSVAVSQANSCSAHQVGQDGEIVSDHFETHGQPVATNKTLSAEHGATATTSDGIRYSKSKESFKVSKKRQVTGLPGHNNSSLRRRPSKRITRQSTPSSIHHDQAANSQAPQQQPQQQQPNLRVQSPSGPTTPTTPTTPPASFVPTASLKPDIEVLKRSDQLVVVDNQVAPSINHPVSKLKGICEPLKNLKDRSLTGIETRRPKLAATRSQPTVVESSSSEGMRKGNEIASAAPNNESSSSSHSVNHRQNHHYYSDPKSADSSRRSSVSQELNQLDDLIFALSKSPAAERFGPLLGIPASARTSRSNSPSTLNARRGTSMTTRPTQSSLSSPTVKKKISLIVTRSPTPSESQAALDELESLRFSAV